MSFINPYLIFNGNSEEAFNFYKSIFGGEFSAFSRYNEMPPQEGCSEMSEEYGDRVMHVALPIGKNILMGGDSNPDFCNVTIGQNVNISITADSKEEADRLFSGFSKDGKVTVAMQDMFWGDYFGMCVDKFGIEWMISYNKNYQIP